MSFEDENASEILDETGQDDEEDGDEAGEVSAAEAPRFGPTDNYDRIAYFYDLEYRYRRQDVRFYLEMARRAGSKSRILEVACGTGRVSQKLLEAGFTVTGLDISKEMLRLAEKKLAESSEEIHERGRYVQGDMRDLDAALGNQEFDLIFIAINSFQHLRSQADQLTCLQSIRKHVAPAGRFIIDVFNPEDKESFAADGRMEYVGPMYNPLNQTYIHVFVSTIAHLAQQKRVHHYFYDETLEDGTVKRTVNVFNLRYLYRFELQLLLEKAGFSIEDLYGDYDFEEYGEGSPKLLYVCRRG
jgi:SAM-dependent methyltransferase